MLKASEELLAPLEELPPFEFAFAYGSGVFQQPGHSKLSRNEEPMVDYVLGVRYPSLWHAQNLEKNPHHYNPVVAYFGGKGVSFIADKIGAGVYFNAFVPWKGKVIKYGVTSMEHLIKDILSWQYLYISGRLQKPVRILVDNWGIAKVNQVNLQAAASAALLLLPSEFTEEEFYKKVCSLSYMGDIRMLFAEDQNKVQKIVRGSAEHFHSLYTAPLSHAAALGLLHLPVSYTGLGSILKRDCSQHAVQSLVSSLPTSVLQKVPAQVYEKGPGASAKAVERAIRSTVRISSLKQVFTGLASAGGINSIRYVWRKACKAWNSR